MLYDNEYIVKWSVHLSPEFSTYGYYLNPGHEQICEQKLIYYFFQYKQFNFISVSSKNVFVKRKINPKPNCIRNFK